jgi:hypothetical protein
MRPGDWRVETIPFEEEMSRRRLVDWIMGTLILTIVLAFLAVFFFVDDPTEGFVMAIFTPTIGLAAGASGFYFAERSSGKNP